MTCKALSNVSTLYTRILNRFPTEHITFCVAYGSGVLQQANTKPKTDNMIDLIFTVNNARQFHEKNMKINKSHYSSLSWLGTSTVSKIQTNISSHMYFNSMIPLHEENVVIKYGVITQDDVIRDLLDWTDLYIAGRLQKPVEIVRSASDESLKTALYLNLVTAVHAALLILPEHFTEAQFYQTITGLSYMGDFRMTFGEDVNKIGNIVKGQIMQFRHLYSPVLKSFADYVDIPTTENEHNNGDLNCSQDVSPAAKHYHLNRLPRYPQKRLVHYWNKTSKQRQDTEDVLRSMAYDHDCGDVVSLVLSQIVWNSSIQQSLKGILTAGFSTSIKYSARKIMKMVASRKKLTKGL